MLSEGLAVFQAADFSKSGNLSFASKFESHLFLKQPEPGQEWLIDKQDFGLSSRWLVGTNKSAMHSTLDICWPEGKTP